MEQITFSIATKRSRTGYNRIYTDILQKIINVLGYNEYRSAIIEITAARLHRVILLQKYTDTLL